MFLSADDLDLHIGLMLPWPATQAQWSQNVAAIALNTIRPTWFAFELYCACSVGPGTEGRYSICWLVFLLSLTLLFVVVGSSAAWLRIFEQLTHPFFGKKNLVSAVSCEILKSLWLCCDRFRKFVKDQDHSSSHITEIVSRTHLESIWNLPMKPLPHQTVTLFSFHLIKEEGHVENSLFEED